MFRFLYKSFIRPFFFRFDPEFIHEQMTKFGELIGRFSWKTWFLSKFFGQQYSELRQNILGLDFVSPIGLAAGFDYNAQLTQVLHCLGFGWQTAGTISRQAYEGNPRPRLGRLIKSQSLMVNKGFKNPGIEKTVQKLKSLDFEIPVGISLGVSNNEKIVSLEQAIDDVVESFKVCESSDLKIKYYELNISCPNLKVKIDFYQSENLKKLLTAIKKLEIPKPILVKMPINPPDAEILEMLKIISEFGLAGVIFGNLQKDRQNESLLSEEVAKFSIGNFSGKPTEKRSNELIKLAYQNFGDKLLIVGCGGVFSAEDAYKKIKLGASMVQLITGMIFEGPQLVSEINAGLVELLKKDGYKNIIQAVGRDAKS